MRHLKEFEEDIFSDIDDLGSLGFATYSGYVVSLTTTNRGNVIKYGNNLVVIIANSEKQAAETFLGDFEDEEGAVENIRTIGDVAEYMEEWFGEDTTFRVESIWQGLKPKTLRNEPSIEAISGNNPYYAAQELEKIFSNVREIMTKHITGTPDIK